MDNKSVSKNPLIKFSEEVLEAVSRVIAEVKNGSEITDFFRMAGYPQIVHDGSTKARFLSEQLNTFNKKDGGSDDIKKIIEKLVQPKQYIGMKDFHKMVIEKVKEALSYDNLTISNDYKIIPLTKISDNFISKKEHIVDSIASRLGRITGNKSIEKIFPQFFQTNYNLYDKSKQEKIATVLSSIKNIDDFRIKLQSIIDYHQSYFIEDRRREFNELLKSVELRINNKLIIEKIDVIDTIENIEKESSKLSSKIISEILPKDLIEKGKEMAKVYTLLYCIENSMRLFIESTLRKKYGTDYMDKIVLNREIKDKIKGRKIKESKNRWLPFRGDSDLFYMDFRELGILIQNNWEIFKEFFPDQNWILVKMKEIAEIRNYVAHNSYLGKDEKDTLKIYYTQILKQIGSTRR